MKWHLSQGLGDEQEDKGKRFKETLKCFEKKKKKGKEKERSPKKLSVKVQDLDGATCTN